jgi:hypothetical protein
MTSVTDIRVLKEFKEPIPVELASLGVEVCNRFKAAYERFNEGREGEERLTKEEFLTTVLVDALPNWIDSKEKAERSSVKKESKGVRSGPAQGRGRGRSSFDVIPHAAE